MSDTNNKNKKRRERVLVGNANKKQKRKMGLEGFEPATLSLKVRCSNR